MSEQIPGSEDILHIINAIESNPASTQRAIAANLGISLGKTNYLFKELIKKGFIKARNFSRSPGRLRKIHYLLTQRGLTAQVTLTTLFLKRKEDEYKRIKLAWDALTARQ
jgi:EPS-associated MarR family transcriptional regulator